ncbi:MAG: dienelactone hydrolase family protein [Ktedonobacteraceae bacterium]|nr:dienelactone hydrolase family protein [Ktedonobacteraceae bacterium]
MAQVTTQELSFSAGAMQYPAYLARPEGEGPFPGIVVIHEAFGLNENIKDVARRFANEGYVALAVDLFAGRNQVMCMFRFIRGQLFDSLNHSGIHALKAALTCLSEQPGVDPTRVGAIGFCLGGGLAIAWACTDDRLKAIAPFYAGNPRPLDAVARACPVVGSYPDKDLTTSQGQKLDVALDRYGVPHDIKIYGKSKHSFFNDQGRSYNADVAQDSWQRVLAFFGEHIKSTEGHVVEQ